MKRIILVRHAKSSWKFQVTDHERPLNTRGFKDANSVSKTLIGSFKPDLVLSSDALRASTTANIFITNLKIDENIVQFNPDLYDFSGSNLLEVVKSCPININTLMVFGHNHALTYFVNNFGDKYIENVPTSGVVVIDFDIEKWNDLKPGKTFYTLFPRDLKS